MALGVVWELLNPAATIMIYYLAFTYILGVDGGSKYPLFIAVGIIHWQLWAGIIMQSTNCVLENAATLDKISFPRQLIPLSVIGNNLYVHAYTLGALLLLSPVLGLKLWWGSLLYFPVLALSIVMVTGVAFAVAALTVFFRDLGSFVDIALRIGFFVSPVLYSFDALWEPWPTILGTLPFAAPLDMMRAVLHENVMPDWNQLVIFGGWAIGALALGIWIYNRTQRNFVEHF